MDLIYKQPIPYKSLQFINQFHHIYYHYSNTAKIKLCSPLFSILLLKTFHHLTFFFTTPAENFLWQFILNDFIFLANLPVEVNLLVVANFLLAIYYLYLHFFQQHFSMNIVAGVFVARKRKQETDVFLFYQKQNNKSKTIQKLPSTYVHQYCFLLLNLLQVFIVALGNIMFHVCNL